VASVPAVRLGERPGLLQRLKTYMWNSRPGPYTGGEIAWTSQGAIPMNWPMNFGQLGYDPLQNHMNSIVYACIMVYARTIAQLPGRHMRLEDDNGTEEVKTSALSRIMRRPNDYQTRSDFMFNLVTSLLYQGNAYGIALRNDRFEIDQLHLLQPRSVQPYISPEGGEIFYSIGSNPILDARMSTEEMSFNRFIVPARDVLHVRVFCPRNPLIGESPIVAAAVPVAMQTTAALGMQQYFSNMSAPSGVLQTELVLSSEQVKDLRARWEEQAKGVNIGGVPILTAGLKWQPSMMALKASDAQVVESMKYAVQDIARVFGVPLALINDMTGATWNNTEQLMRAWLAQGLGFYLEHMELAFDKLFGLELKPDYAEFDIDALLRPDFAARIDGLVKAVQGGIYSPNEARKQEGLPKALKGDEPRVQMQVVPLSWEPPTPASAAGGGSGDTKPDPDPDPAPKPKPAAGGASRELTDDEEVLLAKHSIMKVIQEVRNAA
jgi:HK97 family phage portal protein